MKFSLSDGIVTSLTAVTALALVILFLQDLNTITSRGSEPSLGTITFRKQTATRRSAQSQVWERLQNQSPVYQSDTLRTAEDSEAVIRFDDGLNLELQQNTMLRLTMKGQSRNVDFTEGSVTLSGSSQGSVLLGATGQKLTLSPDAQVLLTKTADTLSLELSQGTASVAGEGGQTQTLSPTQALDLNTQTGATQLRAVDLAPRSPAPGARLLDLEGGRPVDFSFQVSPGRAEISDLNVEVSDRPDFSNAVEVPARPRAGTPGLAEAQQVLAPGTWYWRVAGKDVASASRRFTLLESQPPALSIPADAAEVSYRKKLPSVSFAWSARELVADWTFELSRSADFRSPEIRRRTGQTSLSLDTLDTGTWYWRVQPRYEGVLLGAVPVPDIRSFTIVKREQMVALQPSVPLEGTTLETQELAAKGLAFTWEPVPEAKGYELSAHQSSNPASAVLARFSTATPYLILSPVQLGTLVREGSSHWQLRWLDDEGNASPSPRALRTLNAVDGKSALRPTYPPEGYQIASQFLTNTRFSWKSNLALSTVFQVSRDPDFAEVLFQEPAHDGTMLGRSWGTGTLYWRLTSFNPDGSVFLRTPSRRLDVLEPFAPVVLTEPRLGMTLQLPEGLGTTLVWPAAKGVDYFEVSLLGPGETNAIAFQAQVAQGTGANRLEVPLGRLPEGEYRARVQAFRRESPSSTSVIGLYGHSAFAYQRLQYPSLLQPADGASIDGLQAFRQGVTLVWTSATPAPDAVVDVRKSDGTLVLRAPSTGVTRLAPRFPSGDYLWTVRGTVGAFDLSARKASRFTVKPIPRLAAPTLLAPTDLKVFGLGDLKAIKSIDLTWGIVAGADVYKVTLSVEPGTLLLETEVKGNVLALDKKSLRRGTFAWTVEAVTLGPDGAAEQRGDVAQSHFSIDLPAISAPAVPEESTFYGR